MAREAGQLITARNTVSPGWVVFHVRWRVGWGRWITLSARAGSAVWQGAGQGWIRDGEVLDEVNERPEKKMP